MDIKVDSLKKPEITNAKSGNISRPLTKSGMKKFLRFIILANKRLRKNNKPLTPSKPSFDFIKGEIGDLKNKIKEKNPKVENIINKKNESFKNRFHDGKSKINLIKEEKKELSKELLEKIDKFGKRNLKDHSYDEPKKLNSDPDFDKRSREILDIKSVIFELEKKNKEIVERNEHHPILLKRLEEKIDFLKKRISDIENGR